MHVYTVNSGGGGHFFGNFFLKFSFLSCGFVPVASGWLLGTGLELELEKHTELRNNQSHDDEKKQPKNCVVFCFFFPDL